MTYTIREIRDSLVYPGANPFRVEMPLYGIFEAARLINNQGGYVLDESILGALLGPHEVNNPFTGAPMVTRARYDELEKRLQKVIAHNDELEKRLKEANAVTDAWGKRFTNADADNGKLRSKVDTMYKATNQLAELCTTLIRTLK